MSISSVVSLPYHPPAVHRYARSKSGVIDSRMKRGRASEKLVVPVGNIVITRENKRVGFNHRLHYRNRPFIQQVTQIPALKLTTLPGLINRLRNKRTKRNETKRSSSLGKYYFSSFSRPRFHPAAGEKNFSYC